MPGADSAPAEAAKGLRGMVNSKASSDAAGEPVDRSGEFGVAFRHAAGVVAHQAEIDPVPDAPELRVMVNLFSVKRDSSQEGERLAEILELEAADEALLALLERPAF